MSHPTTVSVPKIVMHPATVSVPKNPDPTAVSVTESVSSAMLSDLGDLRYSNKSIPPTASVTENPNPTTASVTKNPKASRKDLKEVKQYLDNIRTTKIEQVYGIGQYRPWHGDGKSQSRTNITFQTKSQKASGQPPQYITIVAKKGKTDAYVTHTSDAWDSADEIIEAMLGVFEQRAGVGKIESTFKEDRVVQGNSC